MLIFSYYYLAIVKIRNVKFRLNTQKSIKKKKKIGGNIQIQNKAPPEMRSTTNFGPSRLNIDRKTDLAVIL